ncbi:MAG TPA: trigger factor [Gemmatimonadales bacterium]|nr:trigger factor [Gemmatimonadales bacterium]
MAMTGISYETTAQDPASRALKVTVGLDRLDQAEKQAVREYAQHARLPGFRKGHAPDAVVRKRFEGEIRRYVVEQALRESWDAILKETGLKPVADPQVRNVTFEAGQPMQFELIVDIRPEITLATTGGFTTTRTVNPVTDEMVQDQIDRLREQRGAWNPLEGVQPKPGNLVSVSVTPIEPGKEPAGAAPHELVLGQGQTIPDVEERIMTLKPGETTDAEVRFPDDHPDESRRGATRRVRITLHEVKEQALPTLDDAFAREVGDFESVEALRTAIRSDLAAEAAREADARVREDLLRQIAQANNVPAPESMVHRLIHAYAETYQIDKAQFGTFASTFHPIAESQVKRELILDAVAAAQNLRATEADIDAKVAEMAAVRNLPPAKLYASLEQGKRLGELERSITEGKIFAWLLSQSTITEGTA